MPPPRKIINQSDPIFLCRGTHCSWQTFSENQDQEVISFTFEVTEGVVTGVGTADGGDPELVLMRRPLVDMQLCLLQCYLGASHRDPGWVIMLAGQGAVEILHCCVELLHVRQVVAGHGQSAATRLRFPWLRPGKCAGTVARPLVWPHLGGEAVSSGPTRQDIIVTLRNPPSSPHSPLCRVGPLERLVTVLSEVR